MNSDEIWKQLCERHPMFDNPEHVVEIKAMELKAFIDRAYLEGRREILAGIEQPTVLDELFGRFGRL